MDIASLGIKVSTTGARESAADLDKLERAGKGAAKVAVDTSKAFDKAGMSAAQLANATRTLPAQFTDIATGLASGQRPLSVLLQQGGQLKDMFGGVGPAARAMAGYIGGLINPFTLAAAATTALVVAWKEGRSEATEYNKAIVLTGNYAGVTAGQLSDLAKGLAGVAGSQHDAAAALAEVTASGKFTAQQIGQVGAAALAMQQLTGQAIGDTIKQLPRSRTSRSRP